MPFEFPARVYGAEVMHAYGGGMAGPAVNSCRAVIRDDGELSVIVHNRSCYARLYYITITVGFQLFFLLYITLFMKGISL